jgi:CRP/FNR family transcriptional regulator, cyclic AMP receptor protein
MRTGELGIVFDAGQYLFREGEQGDRMYIIQEGEVEVIVRQGGRETRVATRGPGDFVGEAVIFERGAHAADARALTNVRVLGVDRRNFLRRANEDPTLVFRIVQQLSRRVQELGEEVARLRGGSEPQ